MQESLFETVQKLQNENKINVEELETLLKSDIEEVVTLCKKACLKPKTDSKGNAYFTKDDVNMLKKIKELYNQTSRIESSGNDDFDEIIENKKRYKNSSKDFFLTNSDRKNSFFDKAKSKMSNSLPVQESGAMAILQSKIESFGNNLIQKMGDLLSEKMDGFDEIIVELIRAKTENENLRGQINSLNKEVFYLKNELSSYSPLALGLYVKKETEEL